MRDLVTALPEGVAPEQRNGALVLEAPWQLRALAVAVGLHVDGSCDWAAFQSLLAGGASDEEGVVGYEGWVVALEDLATRSDLVTREELDARIAARLRLPPGHDHRHPGPA